jgi:hypothetical protein
LVFLSQFASLLLATNTSLTYDSVAGCNATMDDSHFAHRQAAIPLSLEKSMKCVSIVFRMTMTASPAIALIQGRLPLK